MPVPIVATITATYITATGATLVGSINPQGESGSCWFAYGTTDALDTTVQPVALGGAPVTFTATLSGLAPGVPVFFSAVGETSSGIVSGTQTWFTPEPPVAVTDATQPVVSTGTPAVATPVIAYPLTITDSGTRVVEQGTLGDVQSCVQMIVNCPLGACPELPTFGIPDPVGQQAPPSAAGIIGAIQQWEPRATEEVVVQALDISHADWRIDLTTSFAGAQ